MVDQALLEQALKLNDADRAELANAIWNTVDPDAVPVAPEVAALIDQRVADVETHPMQGRPVEDFIEELRARTR